MRRHLILTVSCLLMVGCAGGDDATGSSAATSSSSAAPTTTAPPERDVAGQANCLAAGLAHAPIASALDSPADLAQAVRFFTAPDLDPATSEAGRAAAVAIAEADFELALANVNVLTGQPVDAEALRPLLDTVDEACAEVP